jgi:3-methyladenine DNA glycosylase AlkD
MPARRPPRTPVHDRPAPAREAATPTRARSAARRPPSAAAGPAAALPDDAATVLARLRRLADPAVRAGYARFGIDAPDALGIAMRDIHTLARSLGQRHDLADALWASGVHEARLLVAFVADPARLTAATMDRWCRTFDNWAVVDTLCFKLFDRTPHAWGRIAAWRTRAAEFAKRAAFALLASVALHDRTRADADFVRTLPWIDAAASDPRNFVKKGVVWALCAIGTRNHALLAAARATAARLAASDDPTARWIGRTATRQLARTRTRGRGDAAAAAPAPKRAAPLSRRRR